MNRRFFMQFGTYAGVLALISGRATAKTAQAAPAVCLMHANEVTAEATGFTRYQHFHTLAIPISILIAPPAEGFSVRTSPLDPDSLDVEAFEQFLKETGLDESLREHSHKVSFTQAQLNRIASGEKAVKVSVLSPKGNYAHDFYFTSSPSSLVKIARGRAKTSERRG